MGQPLEAAIGAQVGTKVPGLAVVAVTADEVVAAESWGLADVASGAAMAPDVLCNWFSMTKIVTATAALVLSERGDLDLDAPVERYYEPFAAVSGKSEWPRATVRQLLSHSSGLTNPLPLRWVHLATEAPPDRRTFVQRLIEKHARLRFEPGSTASYSNLGYLVLGEVIESASGVGYEAFVADSILAALGMAHTGFTAHPDRTWATPYQRRGVPLNVVLPMLLPRAIVGPNHGRFRSLRHFYLDGAAYGGLVGPAEEAARFLQAHLRDGELDGTRLLSAPAARAMRAVSASGKKLEVGIGWLRRGRSPSQDYVEHLGGGAGFWNCMRLYPDRGIGFVVMGNATAYDHDSIVRAALDQLTGRPKL